MKFYQKSMKKRINTNKNKMQLLKTRYKIIDYKFQRVFITKIVVVYIKIGSAK